MEETLSSNLCSRNKIGETLRLSEKCAESVNAAAWIWQNCLFSDSATSSSFFFLRLFVEELAYSWPACFENLSLSLLYSSRCLSAQDGFRGKNTPSDLTLSSWHSQAVKLTANGVGPSKWTGHNKALTQGSPSVTAYASAHSYAHAEKHTHTSKGQCSPLPSAIKYPYTHIHTHTHSDHRLHPPTSLLWLG